MISFLRFRWPKCAERQIGKRPNDVMNTDTSSKGSLIAYANKLDFPQSGSRPLLFQSNFYQRFLLGNVASERPAACSTETNIVLEAFVVYFTPLP